MQRVLVDRRRPVVVGQAAAMQVSAHNEQSDTATTSKSCATTRKQSQASTISRHSHQFIAIGYLLLILISHPPEASKCEISDENNAFRSLSTTTQMTSSDMSNNISENNKHSNNSDDFSMISNSTTTELGANSALVAEQLKLPLYMRIVATFACLIIFIVGVTGNLLVPLVVIKTKYLRNSTNLFLINLSMADLLVLLVCMPIVFIELHSRPETWLLGESMCKLSNFVETLAANGSIFTILAISFERYYAICKPLKAGYKCTRVRATIIICIVWFFATILTSPILIMAKSNETVYIDGSIVYNCILETDSYWPKIYVFGSMFAFFCLPLIVLMLVYWLIGRRLIRENLAMTSSGCQSTTTTTSIAQHNNNHIKITPTSTLFQVNLVHQANIAANSSRKRRLSQWPLIWRLSGADKLSLASHPSCSTNNKPHEKPLAKDHECCPKGPTNCLLCNNINEDDQQLAFHCKHHHQQPSSWSRGAKLFQDNGRPLSWLNRFNVGKHKQQQQQHQQASKKQPPINGINKNNLAYLGLRAANGYATSAGNQLCKVDSGREKRSRLLRVFEVDTNTITFGSHDDDDDDDGHCDRTPDGISRNCADNRLHYYSTSNGSTSTTTNNDNNNINHHHHHYSGCNIVDNYHVVDKRQVDGLGDRRSSSPLERLGSMSRNLVRALTSLGRPVLAATTATYQSSSANIVQVGGNLNKGSSMLFNNNNNNDDDDDDDNHHNDHEFDVTGDATRKTVAGQFDANARVNELDEDDDGTVGSDGSEKRLFLSTRPVNKRVVAMQMSFDEAARQQPSRASLIAQSVSRSLNDIKLASIFDSSTQVKTKNIMQNKQQPSKHFHCLTIKQAPSSKTLDALAEAKQTSRITAFVQQQANGGVCQARLTDSPNLALDPINNNTATNQYNGKPINVVANPTSCLKQPHNAPPSDIRRKDQSLISVETCNAHAAPSGVANTNVIEEQKDECVPTPSYFDMIVEAPNSPTKRWPQNRSGHQPSQSNSNNRRQWSFSSSGGSSSGVSTQTNCTQLLTDPNQPPTNQLDRATTKRHDSINPTNANNQMINSGKSSTSANSSSTGNCSSYLTSSSSPSPELDIAKNEAAQAIKAACNMQEDKLQPAHKANGSRNQTSVKIAGIECKDDQPSVCHHQVVDEERMARTYSSRRYCKLPAMSFSARSKFRKSASFFVAQPKKPLTTTHHSGSLSYSKTSSKRATNCTSNNQITSSECIVVKDLSAKKQQMDSRRQVVVMLAFVVTCFFLLFLPYRVFTVWLILSSEDQVQSLGMETYYNLTYFSRILIYLHSAINPIAYNLISTKFRAAFMSILFCRGSATRRQFITDHNNHHQSCNSRRTTTNATFRLDNMTTNSTTISGSGSTSASRESGGGIRWHATSNDNYRHDHPQTGR